VVNTPKVAATGWCFCGCGAQVPPGRHWVPSHDRKAETRIIREGWGTIADFVRAHDPSAGQAPSSQ
jgi:hypothetical protein